VITNPIPFTAQAKSNTSTGRIKPTFKIKRTRSQDTDRAEDILVGACECDPIGKLRVEDSHIEPGDRPETGYYHIILGEGMAILKGQSLGRASSGSRAIT
jgi:hypothetical protein